MEREYECIILEDENEYAILEKIKYKEKEFIYLFNTTDPKDFCVRKHVGEVLTGLDNEEEFELAMELIKEKNKDILEKIKL